MKGVTAVTMLLLREEATAPDHFGPYEKSLVDFVVAVVERLLVVVPSVAFSFLT